MRGWWQEISGLVLPAACGGCGIPRTPLCEECAHELYGSAARRATPDPEPDGMPEVHAAAGYVDAVRAVLLAHKERGVLGLARPLGVALAGAVRAAVRDGWVSRGGVSCGGGRDGPEPDGGVLDAVGFGGAGLDGLVFDGGDEWQGAPLLLVPVPSARRAVRARGHDATRRIARAAAGELRRTGRQARALPVLRQLRPVADQAGLTARERAENVSGALRAVSGAGRLLAGGRVVLVDDLMTTGASLAEAARALGEALDEAGAGPWRAPVSAAVVAAPVSALALR
ncbi:ComF family protein [Streptomyces sp. NPDC020412]|uniref:ComF family protein n=1 Tax=Streptomyces sp. NPDC020412 TaxID=3365073 RepID=UPI003789B9AC